MATDSDFAQAMRKRNEQLRVIYERRGEFIAQMNSLEGVIDNTIMVYFGHKVTEEEFQCWILGSLSTSDKIRIVGQIVKAIGLPEAYKPYLSDLQWANEFRNEIAHSQVSPFLDLLPPEPTSEQFEEVFLQLHSIRYSRAGSSATPVDVEALIDKTKRLTGLWLPSVALMLGAIAHREGRDGVEAVESFLASQARNPFA